jgi:hypothetical protein
MFLKPPHPLLTERAKRLVNLLDYRQSVLEKSLRIGGFDVSLPPAQRSVLRLPICMGGAWSIPSEFDWLKDFIRQCVAFQETYFVAHPFWYLTVRRTDADPTNRSSQWHVDGFSLRTPHLPEMNYLWCSEEPTLFYERPIFFPDDFDGKRHNLQSFVAERIDHTHVVQGQARQIYLIDPYVIHKKPDCIVSTRRFLIRLSNIPVEIEDDLYTPNPAFPTRCYGRVGKDVADQFKKY